MFKINDLWFRYDSKYILKSINLTIKKGSFISIIGPNGSGKTTLMNLLTGNLKKDTGEIFFLDKLLHAYSIETLAQVITVIYQKANIQFPFTCLEIVMMGRNPFKQRMKPLSEKDMEIVYEAMEVTDTLKFTDSLITEISGGEMQRVILARALAQEPQVLFLDEAFSAMDIAYRLRSLKLISQLVKEKNVTVISIMHDLNMAYAFSDEVIVLKEGKIRGTDCPQNLMTASFIKEIFDIDVYHVKGKGLIVMP